jgi:hypothetical protein
MNTPIVSDQRFMISATLRFLISTHSIAVLLRETHRLTV